MSDNEFDAFVNKLQGEVFTEAKNALGEKGFERWNNPKFCGEIHDADGFARLTGGCGDTMEMYIKIRSDRVEKVGYLTDGCSSSSIAGSFAAELAMGKTFEEVLDLRGTDVLQMIGQFPENEEHCAHLAVRTLQEALNTFLIKHSNNRSIQKKLVAGGRNMQQRDSGGTKNGDPNNKSQGKQNEGQVQSPGSNSGRGKGQGGGVGRRDGTGGGKGRGGGGKGGRRG